MASFPSLLSVQAIGDRASGLATRSGATWWTRRKEGRTAHHHIACYRHSPSHPFHPASRIREPAAGAGGWEGTWKEESGSEAVDGVSVPFPSPRPILSCLLSFLAAPFSRYLSIGQERRATRKEVAGGREWTIWWMDERTGRFSYSLSSPTSHFLSYPSTCPTLMSQHQKGL